MKKHRHFPALDGLRCVAITLVMVAHAGLPVLRSGGTGVDVFFVLSGFLITRILVGERETTGTINLRHFYARRFLRLLPAMWLAIAFVAIEQRLVVGALPLQELAASLGYGMNWLRVVAQREPLALGHLWSLAIEEQFYLIWPLVITAVCNRVASPRARCAAFGVIAMSLALYRAAMVGHYSVGRIYFGSDTHADGLVMGAAAAFLIDALPGREFSERLSEVMGRLIAPVAALVLAAISLRLHWWDAAMARYGYVLAGLAAAAIVLDVAAGSHSLARAMLSHRSLIWIGKISYGLYLWHFPIYRTMDDLGVPTLWWLKLTVGVPISVAVAATSYYTVERYFLTLKGRFQVSGKSVTALSVDASTPARLNPALVVAG